MTENINPRPCQVHAIVFLQSVKTIRLANSKQTRLLATLWQICQQTTTTTIYDNHKLLLQ